MRIKKLELCGFKSFKDRTVIHFHEGITGIVGPNGCGKSNIVDALVWAMGEQSAKHLRGSNMSDVIFGGAEGYAPGGMAEVSITLENDGGAFPAKYLNHSEIMVTRKLHRSGESEYLVNKQPARLRDITEVFMDTGAGAKGFSIIEQGAIGKIVTAKPLDRRSLIEEAAGITKFKARKKESQRKLVQTEQNLVRINDIVTELKRRIDALQRQAKKAERYRRIKEELEDLDLWLSSKKFLKLKDDSDEAEKVFADAQDTEVGSLSDLEQIETELETLKLEMLEKEKALEVEQIKHEELKDNVRRKEMELQSLSFEVEQAKRKGEMTENIAQELETRREALAESVEGLKTQTTELETTAESLRAEYETKKEAFDNIHESIVDLETELNTSRRSLNELSGRESADAARLSSLDSQMDELSTREETSGQTLAELRAQKDEFEGIHKKSVHELENSRQMQLDIMKDVDNFQENRDQIFANTENKRKEVAEFKEELNLVTSRLYGLENLQASFEGFEEGVKNVMLWHRKRYEATADGGMQEVPEMLPISEVVSVPEDYEVAMEAALGGRLQVLLTENQDLSLGAIDYLKDNNTGRSSFLSANADDSSASEQSTPSGEGFVNLLTDVVSAPDKYSQSVQLLLNKVAIVDSVRTALRMRPAYPGWTFVTKDGDTLSADGVLTGGAQDSADSGILKRKREIQDLSQKKEEWAGKLALATTALEKLEKQLKQIDIELEEAKKAKYEQEIRLAELKKDVERSEKEFQNAQRAYARQEEEFSQLSAKKAKLEEEIDALSSSLEDTRTQKVQTEERVTELDEELVSTKLGIGDLQTSVTDLKVELASKDQELSGLRRQLEMQEQSLSDVMAKINSVSADAAQNTELMSENQIQLEQEKVALEQQIGEVERFAEKFSGMKDSFEQESADLKEREADLLKRRRVYTDRQQKMNDAQLKLEQAKMKETYLIDQVKERYLINLAEVAENYREREGDMEQAERDVTELREKLKKMGEVNLSAIEEYDDTIERYEFLSKQQEDLLAAKKELNRVIERINRICSKRFRDTFEAVNERFKTAFPVLFGGGEAKLTLIEDEEKDEMGIDIMARPPGKKLQSVSLLSGGEKALTAVALI
ncbi:MAG: chromosome segregation protein SMC, partial [Bdellovibrionota bacterium]|nr:chromosome segregation protein SMC [Bdellovibrionota bacterium]